MVFDGVGLAEKTRRGLLEGGKLVGKRLVVFQTGDRESVYVRLKRKMGEGLGVKVEVRIINDLGKLKEDVLEAGRDPKVNGVLVQLPITGASEVGRDEILKLIPVEKDVDGLNPDGGRFLPAAAVAVEKILKNFKVTEQLFLPMQNPGYGTLKLAVVGSKGMIGKALAKRFSNLGYKVYGVDIERMEYSRKMRRSLYLGGMVWGSGEAERMLKKADVVISATGQAGLIKPDMVKDGVVAIDLGYPKADFDRRVEEKARFFTPVPGGVGPVTVVSLFENLAKT